MNISYELWPIWADYLEEQGQDTTLLRYVMTYSAWNNLAIIHLDKLVGNGANQGKIYGYPILLDALGVINTGQSSLLPHYTIGCPTEQYPLSLKDALVIFNEYLI